MRVLDNEVYGTLTMIQPTSKATLVTSLTKHRACAHVPDSTCAAVLGRWRKSATTYFLRLWIRAFKERSKTPSNAAVAVGALEHLGSTWEQVFGQKWAVIEPQERAVEGIQTLPHKHHLATDF